MRDAMAGAPVDTREAALTELGLRLGKRIAELRAARRFTLEQLAGATGFTKGYLSKIENSRVIPPIGALVRVAHTLGTDVADLLGREGTPADHEKVCIVRSRERETVVRGGSFAGAACAVNRARWSSSRAARTAPSRPCPSRRACR